MVGLTVGALTSLLQQYLNAPWLSLVNAVSPWLIPMFALGALFRRPAAAAAAGGLTGLLELAGYYATAAARGYPTHGYLLFWTLCAVAGGPLYGIAGWAWWRAARPWRSLGAACLPAAFFAEATVVYAARLHYWSSAILFIALGAAGIALLGRRGRQYGRLSLWLLAAFPAGVAAELLLGLVYIQAS